MKTVELIPAHFWQCDNCGCENFVRSIVAEFSDDEIAEMKLDHGIDVLAEGHFLTKPTEVECASCLERFVTVEFGEE
jgi:hypothetical protein